MLFVASLTDRGHNHYVYLLCTPPIAMFCMSYNYSSPNILHFSILWGNALAQWLRCCATNRKVAGSIPGGVIGIFHLHYPSDRTVALGSTQLLTEMSTRSITRG